MISQRKSLTPTGREATGKSDYTPCRKYGHCWLTDSCLGGGNLSLIPWTIKLLVLEGFIYLQTLFKSRGERVGG